MRKFLNSRYFRILVCFVLICCFLVNLSPIKAEAVLAELTAFGWVPVAAAAASLIIALGVMAGSDHTAFNEAVNNCVTWLTNSTTFVVNGMVNVLGLMCSDGIVRSYLARDMVQSVWEWLSVSGTVVNTQDLNFATSHEYQLFTQSYSLSASVPFDVVGLLRAKSSSKYEITFYAIAESSFSVNDGSLSYSSEYYGYYHAASFYTASRYFPVTSLPVPVFEVSDFETGPAQIFGTLITPQYVAEGLVLGQYQEPTVGTDEEIISIEIAPIYVDWTTGKVSATPPDSGEGKKEFLPVGIPSTDDDELLLSQSQQQAQSGETNLEFDFESSGDSSGDGTGDGSGTGTDSGDSSGSSGSWTPPKDASQFKLVDLSKFFPFCIPFDLFEFFKLLYAEPVAPVLYWEIQDLAGETYSLSIDLSEWDSVALLFRRLQLFLFVTGLAAASRKFIKW